MQQVKQMLAAGVSVSTAIKEALGMSVTAFADKHELARTITSEMLNLSRFPDLPTCTALAKELGGEPYDWALLLWKAAKPVKTRFADAAESTV